MLTEQQSAALRLIARHQRENHGVTPTYRAMMESLGIKSTNGVHRMVLGLEARGCIHRLPRKARAIEILPLGFYYLRSAA